jgi:hypothetical protein
MVDGPYDWPSQCEPRDDRSRRGNRIGNARPTSSLIDEDLDRFQVCDLLGIPSRDLIRMQRHPQFPRDDGGYWRASKVREFKKLMNIARRGVART